MYGGRTPPNLAGRCSAAPWCRGRRASGGVVSRARRSYAFIIGALALVALVLFVGRGVSTPETVTSRADRIASEIRCPTCQGLSVRASKAAGARAIYAEITRQVESGEKDADIRAFLVDRFGTSELLRPRATGIGAIVWIAPVAVVVVGAAVLVNIFARTRRPTLQATEEDRELVEAALAEESVLSDTPEKP